MRVPAWPAPRARARRWLVGRPFRLLLLCTPTALGCSDAFAQVPAAPPELIARAKSLEIDTPYEPPPGDPYAHHAAGFANVMCSAVFITGLDAEFAAEHVGYFVAPYSERARMGKPRIDAARRMVEVSLPSGVTRTALFVGDQGCVTLPLGRTTLGFTPRAIPKRARSHETRWPAGDVRSAADIAAAGADASLVKQAVDAAFEPPEAETAAFVVTWKGRLIAERYGPGITDATPLEGWSMGKSVTATLLGVLIRKGAYKLWEPAPIPEWQKRGDPRARIRIGDLLQMSSGLRSRAPQDPEFEPSMLYPDHIYVYTAPDAAHWAATRPLQWPPGTIGRYRNTDPVLANYLIRLAVEKRGDDYLAFPQRALFDRLGIRTMVLEPDASGTFLGQGYVLASARDWARLGNLYLQDGVWDGERILPKGWSRFVSTLAPAWRADGRPIYGAFFWINGDGKLPVPRDAYYMAGAGGQTTLIIPSHDLVVVRLGHFKGSTRSNEGFHKALALLMKAVPAHDTHARPSARAH